MGKASGSGFAEGAGASAVIENVGSGRTNGEE